MLGLAFVLISLGFATNSYASIGPITDLHIVNAPISPDGFSRVGTLAEGTFPGPAIVGNKNDYFKINVVNQLTDASMIKSTTIHWHGLHQQGSSWADGVASVTQCPITPDHSFEYRFHAKNQAGTFWYHSHLSTQYCDGLRGPFIVYDTHDPHRLLYDVDDETTILALADWYHMPMSEYPKGKIIPESTLINGLGRYKDGPASPLAIVNVEFGKRYRFRLISMSCDPDHVFSIDDHLLTVIEADGVNTQPLLVDSIQIYAGQRYSFILNAIGTRGNYWIRANPNLGTKGFDNGLNQAILRYKGATEEDPTTTSHDFVMPLDERNLHPLENPGAPGEHRVDGADVNLNLAISFDQAQKKFTMNGHAFVPPTIPVLLQILSGSEKLENLLPSDTLYSLPPNKTVQISMPAVNNIGAPHPMHLHGHVFDVVRSAGSTEYNFANPVRRDVVNTGFEGNNVTIRFRTDNAGPWFLHCHIDRHIEGGLAVIFAEDSTGVKEQQNLKDHSVPESWKKLCPLYEALEASEHKQTRGIHNHHGRFDSHRDLF